MVIFIDMDEVLCDFIGGVCRVLGLTRGELEPYRQPGEWEVVSSLDRWDRERGGAGFDLDRFWEVIHAGGEQFWVDLDRLPWFDDVLAVVEHFTKEWYVLSAPSRDPVCQIGKIRWLQKHIDGKFDRYLLTPHKYLLANSESVLIDDRFENVAKFMNHGGYGCLFPSFGNIHARHHYNPLPLVERRLHQLAKDISKPQ